jgi:hypothetical protein
MKNEFTKSWRSRTLIVVTETKNLLGNVEMSTSISQIVVGKTVSIPNQRFLL